MVTTMEIRTQLELAILSDFFGPAARLQRLAGLSDVHVDERFYDLEPEPSIADRLQPAHRRARALLQLVVERHGEMPGGSIGAAMAQVRQCVKEMEA